MNKQKENLIAINEWCKSISLDDIVYVDNALFCNGKYYRISISKMGIGTYAGGKFSRWLHVVDGSDSLFGQKIGSELIYNWPDVKQKILNAIEDKKRKQYIMENFTV